jgi:hypothetical protein
MTSFLKKSLFIQKILLFNILVTTNRDKKTLEIKF